jgi:hypothetical protein
MCVSRTRPDWKEYRATCLAYSTISAHCWFSGTSERSPRKRPNNSRHRSASSVGAGPFAEFVDEVPESICRPPLQDRPQDFRRLGRVSGQYGKE